MASVEIRDVRKSYGTSQVLHGVSVDIQDGEFVILVGPSGCGKSTLLRMLAGLESITGGEIRIGPRVVNDIPPKERDIAMVFQNYALYPHMRVADNLGFSLRLARQPKAVTHDALVSVSLDLARVPARRARPTDALSAGLQLLVEELRLFSVRLEAGGLSVDPPLSPAEITAAVRSRSAPFAETQHRALGSSLAAGLGVAAADLAPMAVVEQWDHVRVDRAVHRAWWVEGWPRAEVPALWMDLLLLGGVCTRTVTVVFEPVAPSQSARAVDEASVALESAEASKSKRGFRVRAGDRRAREEVERREHELVAGHGELAYCGLITVSAPTIEELDDAGADFEQTAAHAGLQLRPLEGRHGAGWVASLPLGRTVAARRQR